ncbi:hypothetical protein PENTCL1PPCAC_18072, partial [Pristionchus entomophagus]
ISMDDIPQSTLTGQGVVYVLAVAFNLLLLYFSLFGQRMPYRAVRWHILNVSVWNIVSTVFYSSYGDHTPWMNYMHNANVEHYYGYIKQFCFTTFHNGMILVFIESLIVFFIPSLDNSFLFSMFWLFLICGLANATLLFTFLARVRPFTLLFSRKVNAMFWYDPISLYQVSLVVIFTHSFVIYLIAFI